MSTHIDTTIEIETSNGEEIEILIEASYTPPERLYPCGQYPEEIEIQHSQGYALSDAEMERAKQAVRDEYEAIKSGKAPMQP